MKTLKTYENFEFIETWEEEDPDTKWINKKEKNKFEKWMKKNRNPQTQNPLFLYAYPLQI